jgi:hypothetical protein
LLYIPSGFRRNHPLFEPTGGVLPKQVMSRDWRLRGQSGQGGSEGCHRAPRTVLIGSSRAFPPSSLPSVSYPPPAPAPLAWRYGGGTAVLRCWSHGPRPPWGQQATAQPAPRHQQASPPLTSPSSKHAGNPSLRPAGAVPLGPTGKAAKEVGRGDFGASRSGHVPRHLNRRRSRPGLRDAPFWLPPILGRCQKLRCARPRPALACTLTARQSN